jgi:hypothetical protein
MLTPDGISTGEGGLKIAICKECHSALALAPPHVPKFALKNNLYRGTLPNHLQDITWVTPCQRKNLSAQWSEFNAPKKKKFRSKV